MEQERFIDLERYIEQEEFDIKEILITIKKWIMLVIILPIIFSGIAGVISFFVLKPVYQASVSIIIGKEGDSVLTQSDVTMYQNLKKTYMEIAKSAVVAERAVKDGNLEISPGALQSNLTVSSEDGTQVLLISMNSNEPTDSVEKVEALSQAFLQESERLLPSANIEIMDHAKVPASPMEPNKIRNILIAFVAGLFVAIVLAILIENMNDTVKLEEDVEKKIGMPILGIIP